MSEQTTVSTEDEPRVLHRADEEQRAAAWDDEHRSGPSFKERSRALSEAIREQPDAGALSAYLYDFDDDTAVYESGGKLFEVPYEAQSDGSVTLGAPQEVHAVVSYEANADRTPSEKRLKPGMEACDTCDGTGEVEGDTCEDCGGTGEVQAGEQNAAPSKTEQRTAAWAAKERRKARAELVEGMPERRYWQPTWGPVGLEIREQSDGIIRVGGYASVTEVWYEVGDYEERAVRGSFKRTLGEHPDVMFLANHADMPLARTKTQSLSLEEPRKGLRYDADLQSHDPDVKRLLPKLEREDMDESSFAFRARDQEWDADYTKRSLIDIGLHKGDVSVVNHGANSATTASLRALQDVGFEHLSEGLRELRAGKTLSGANEAALTQVLQLVASADESVDEAQPLLARVLGVANPDMDEPDEDDTPRSAPVSFIEHAKARKARALREAS